MECQQPLPLRLTTIETDSTKGRVEQVVSLETSESLPLRSNTSYSITVLAVNSIG